MAILRRPPAVHNRERVGVRNGGFDRDNLPVLLLLDVHDLFLGRYEFIPVVSSSTHPLRGVHDILLLRKECFSYGF